MKFWESLHQKPRNDNKKKKKKKKKRNEMASPGFEPETFSVLDWRDNQLHHDTLTLKYLQCLIRRQSVMKGQRPKVVDSNKTAWRSFLLCLRASPLSIYLKSSFDSSLIHIQISQIWISLSLYKHDYRFRYGLRRHHQDQQAIFRILQPRPRPTLLRTRTRSPLVQPLRQPYGSLFYS